MIIQKYNSEQEWLDARLGKITGTSAQDVMPKVRGTGYRAGFYKLIAERIAIPDTNKESAMDRGHRLEEEAIEHFAEKTGKKVTPTSWTLCLRDDEPSIAYSPDGMIGNTEDVEVKCRNSALHIEAILTKKVPSEYEAQIIQGFVVNDKLKKRYMVFYDPRCPIDLFVIEIERKDVQEKIDEFLRIEREVLVTIADIEKQLTF